MCGWLTNAGFAPEWKPDHCKMIVTYTPAEHEMVILCDPGYPDIWRHKLYLPTIQKWAVESRALGARVMISVGKKLTLIAPEGEFPIGELGADEGIVANFVGDRLVGVRVAKKSEGEALAAAAPPNPGQPVERSSGPA